MPDAAPDLDTRSVGARIERLLDASAAAGPAARDRAEELVRLVAELYGAGLERLLDLAYDAGALSDELLARIADDDLVESLLLVHGLHPYPAVTRARRALDRLHTELGSAADGVELVEANDAGVIRVRLPASCGCGSSTATLEGSVREAIETAVPEASRIEFVAESATAALISVDALATRLRAETTVG
jgi:Fe-S cluster biogenesis protein NfuA